MLTPALSNGNLLWWDAADGATISSSGGVVSSWSSKTGTAMSFGVGTYSGPITNSVSRNGLNVISFNGTDQGLLMSTGGMLYPLTVGIVFQRTNSPGSSKPIFSGYGGAGSGLSLISQTDSTTTFFGGAGHLSLGTNDLNWHYVVGLSNGASSWLRKDGVQVASGNIGIANGNFNYPMRLAVDDSTNYSAVNIAEITVCGDLTGSNLLGDLESYFANRWAI